MLFASWLIKEMTSDYLFMVDVNHLILLVLINHEEFTNDDSGAPHAIARDSDSSPSNVHQVCSGLASLQT